MTPGMIAKSDNSNIASVISKTKKIYQMIKQQVNDQKEKRKRI